MDTPTLIRCLRNAGEYSQADIGAELGITRQMVSRYERGIDRPSVDVAYRIIDLAQRLDIPLGLEDVLPRQSA